MKKNIVIMLFLIFSAGLFAEEADMWTMTDDTVYYKSVTTSADFNYREAYKPISFSASDLFQDIKVSAVESVPFAFLYTFAGLWVSKAMQQERWDPNLGKIDDEDNKRVLIISLSAFAIVNVAVNTLAYYDYDKKKKVEGK